jgi:N-methylhydantoinase B
MSGTILVCTKGFADVLTLGRQNRTDLYCAHIGESIWLRALPEHRRFEVAGRIDANGTEVEPLALEPLLSSLRALPIRPDTVAVSLLFAKRNPIHETLVRQVLETELPGCRVILSSQIEAEAAHGEFEQTVATLRAAGVTTAVTDGVTAVRVANAPVSLPAPSVGLAAELEAIADQMQTVLVGSAVSSVVREAMDCAAALFLPDGRLMAQARSLPLLLGSLSPAVAGLVQQFPVENMQPGDGFLSNDPWSGGTHLPDFILMRPVVIDGQVKALVACILHHQDVGGITPGSVPTNAISIQQEGLRIPPIQLFHEGMIDQGLIRLICANSRMPENLSGDLNAQWQCLEQGADALKALIDHHGSSFIDAAEGLLADSEASTREAIAKVADGVYQFSDALDGDGVSPDPIAIHVVLHKQGSNLRIDLSECAQQTTGPVNASPGAVAAAITYFARRLAPHAASNHGCLMPIDLVSKKGTVVDPLFPAAINARTNLLKLLANALLGAWAKAAPDETPAPNAGVAVVLSLSGEADGKRWLFTEIIASAAGGAPWQAGGSGVSTDVSNARNTPAQVIEAQAPIRVEHVGLHPDSAGRGRFDGGSGVLRIYRLLAGEGVISYRGERHTIAARGAAGGLPGACGSARLERADGSVEQLPAKARATWRAGDRLVIATAGAGGWGAAGTPARMLHSENLSSTNAISSEANLHAN